MGSLIMHVCVSEIIRKKYSFSDKFLFGALMPDMLKSTGESKDKTHYIKDVVESSGVKKLPDILGFEKANEKILKQEETMGYLCHLIQDKIWFDKYIGKYAKTDANNINKIEYLQYGVIHSSRRFSKDIYNDYKYFNNYIIKKGNFDVLDIVSRLENMTNDKKILDFINEYIKCEDDVSDLKSVFMSKEDLDTYVNECVNKCSKEIDKIISIY